MLLRSNAHTHTTYCDGKNSVEEMIQAALERDFISLGFSSHGWNEDDPSPMTLEQEPVYIAELKAMREKYRGRLEIIIGVEKDCLYDREYTGFEYQIDSTHFFRYGGELLCADWSEEKMLDWTKRLFGGDFYAYTGCYYRQVASVCARSSAAFIGHIDLITKFNEGGRHFDESAPVYLNQAKEAIACAIERDVPLEMNTGAISRGYRVTPYPNPILLKFIREQGGRIIINSDCHNANALDIGFDTCLELARAAGFKSVLRLREGARMEEVGI